MKAENKILELTFNFSLQIIELYKQLVQQNEYVLSKQLLRSATSIGLMLKKQMQHKPKRILLLKWLLLQKKQGKQDIGLSFYRKVN